MSYDWLNVVMDGRLFKFDLYRQELDWPECPGVYMFVTETATAPVVHYVGKCDEFCSRMPNHDRWEEAQRKGATLVAACEVQSDEDRSALEVTLIQHWKPDLNYQHNTGLQAQWERLKPRV